MKDLVIQGALSDEALDTFKVVGTPERIVLGGTAARCIAIDDNAETRKAVRALADYWKLDAAFVEPGLKFANFRVLALDMDSTLINIECVDEIARWAGRGEEVAAITEAAMRGEIADYKESLRLRVGLLAGVEASALQHVYDNKLRLNPGAERLLAAARQVGMKTLLVSGGFTYFTDRLQQRLGFDATRSNEIEVADGKLTGRVTGPGGGEIVDADGKAQALRDLCAQIGCGTAAAIALGDGANDLKMMKLAGISVAYRAKPVVQQQATYALNHSGLDGVLNWFAETVSG
jgi:phosphoserine phosphatase